MKIPPHRFEEEIAAAMRRLPKFLRDQVHEHGVAVIAECAAPEEDVFAHFDGPTAADFATGVSPHPPTVILYRPTFERACGSEAVLRDEIYRTLVHEFGHFLGLEEDDLDDV